MESRYRSCWCAHHWFIWRGGRWPKSRPLVVVGHADLAFYAGVVDVAAALGTEREVAGYVVHGQVARTQRAGTHGATDLAQGDIAGTDTANLGVTLDDCNLEVARAHRTGVQTADVSGVDITRTHADGKFSRDLAHMQVARTHDALQLLHAMHVGVAGAHADVQRHAGGQVHRDFEVGVGAAEQTEREVLLGADVDSQLVTVTLLGDLQLLQYRFVRGARPPGQAQSVAAAIADDVQILAVHGNLHRFHTGQVELEVARCLELARRGESGERDKQQRGKGETMHGHTPVDGVPAGMQPASKRLQGSPRGGSAVAFSPTVPAPWRAATTLPARPDRARRRCHLPLRPAPPSCGSVVRTWRWHGAGRAKSPHPHDGPD